MVAAGEARFDKSDWVPSRTANASHDAFAVFFYSRRFVPFSAMPDLPVYAAQVTVVGTARHRMP
jgi:hypothetical protein